MSRYQSEWNKFTPTKNMLQIEPCLAFQQPPFHEALRNIVSKAFSKVPPLLAGLFFSKIERALNSPGALSRLLGGDLPLAFEFVEDRLSRFL
jgi:hypothetical protein